METGYLDKVIYAPQAVHPLFRAVDSAGNEIVITDKKGLHLWMRSPAGEELLGKFEGSDRLEEEDATLESLVLWLIQGYSPWEFFRHID